MVLFVEATKEQIETVMECLNKLCKCSGQRVNKLKSTIFFSKNVCKGSANKIANMAGIPTTDDLGRYLGSHPSMVGSQKATVKMFLTG